METRMQNLSFDFYGNGNDQAGRYRNSGCEISRLIDIKSSFRNLQTTESFNQRQKNDFLTKQPCRSVKVPV